MGCPRSALLLSVLLPQGPGVPPGDPSRALLRDLEPLAKWCAENRLSREHHRCCAILVHFVPDHREARRVLQFVRGKDGTWRQSPRYVAPKATKEDLLPEFERRFAALASPFKEQVLHELEHGAAGRRGRLLADLLAVLPDDAAGRAAAGEARDGERWFLRESVAGKQHAPALRAAAAECVAGAETPEESEPTAEESGRGLAWTSCLQGSSLRVLATVGAQEAMAAARSSAAAAQLFRRTFRVDTRLQYGFTLVQLEPAHKQAFLDGVRFPKKTDREFAERLKSFWVPRTAVVATAAPTPDERVEWSVRQTLGDLLRLEFGITGTQGALFEGVGLYLSWLVTGWRGTYFVAPDRYGRSDKSLADKLADRKTDWLAEAAKLMDQGPWLDGLLRKEVHMMHGEDLVLSFAFAAWLLEGHEEVIQGFLIAAAEGDPPERLLPEHFRSDPLALEARIRRWIRERQQLDPALPG
jgi:hypothetical protein